MRRRRDSARRVLRPAPVGDRAAGVADHPGPGDAAAPRRRPRHAAGGRLLRRDDRHAYALLDSYVYGFALQEAGLPFEGPDAVGDVAEPIMEQMARRATIRTSSRWPPSYYLKPGYDFGDEFEFGLDLILDGLARSLSEPAGG